MRYLKEEPFQNRKGQIVMIPVTTPNGNATLPLSVGNYINLVLGAYTPSSELQLTMAQWRRCQIVMDILEADVPESGWFAFEDADYVILGKTVSAIVPKMLMPQLVQNGPQLVDLLQDAPSKLPEDDTKQVAPRAERRRAARRKNGTEPKIPKLAMVSAEGP